MSEYMDHREMELRCLLLEIKDIDIRLDTIYQAVEAADRGIHIGGAYSAVVPLTALYYGGILRFDPENPAANGQDLFVLSKGHAVAALASVYADLGFFPREVLKNSRSVSSILNGHPGPLLPGIHTATGPMGQGIAVAEGFAMAGRLSERFDSYCLTGDGELQEGSVWEAVMYAGSHGLDNFCVMVDNNEGQLDDSSRLHIPCSGLKNQFESFGWRTIVVSGKNYRSVMNALLDFKHASREGQPTAVILRTEKGFGGFSAQMTAHKTVFTLDLYQHERKNLRNLREARTAQLIRFLSEPASKELSAKAAEIARTMNLELDTEAVHRKGTAGIRLTAEPVQAKVKLKPAPPRNKEIPGVFQADLTFQDECAAQNIITQAMENYAQDWRVVSIDSDLSSTSGLFAGVSRADRRRAYNVGIAEANMMCIGEAFAILGYNAWVSTFCPFFNWNVLRRIAVSQQERQEVMADPEGWLTKGHGLDITFLATASNLDTKANGATHMGNDDALVFTAVPGLRIIDVSCPNLLSAAVKWIMEGNRGLVYLRIMRAASGVIHPGTVVFEYGKSFRIAGDGSGSTVLVSSGRGVHEALKAAEILEDRGISADVVDMPSPDPDFFEKAVRSGKLLVFPEQNDGVIYTNFVRITAQRGLKSEHEQVLTINTLGSSGKPRFIHSGTYEELTRSLGLDPEGIAGAVLGKIKE
jgi:transketolase